MRLLTIVILLLSWAMTFGQVRPDHFVEETDPNDGNFEVYSQKNGQPKKASLVNLRKYFVPGVEIIPILYIPTATGNVSDLGWFVEDPMGDTWYIDGDGNAIKVGSIGTDDQVIEEFYIQSDTLYLTIEDGTSTVKVDLSQYDLNIDLQVDNISTGFPINANHNELNFESADGIVELSAVENLPQQSVQFGINLDSLDAYDDNDYLTDVTHVQDTLQFEVQNQTSPILLLNDISVSELTNDVPYATLQQLIDSISAIASGDSSLFELINPYQIRPKNDSNYINVNAFQGYQIDSFNALSISEDQLSIKIGNQSNAFVVSDNSIHIGKGAGDGAPTTGESVLIGVEAGNTATSQGLTAVGHNAGKSGITNSAAFFGYKSGENSLATGGTGFGYLSCRGHNGLFSTGFGYKACNSNLGAYAIGIGHEAGLNNIYDYTFMAGSGVIADQDSQIIFADYFTQLKAGTYRFNIDQTVGGGQDNFVLTYDNSSDEISLEASAGGSDGNDYLTAVTHVQDTLTFVVQNQTDPILLLNDISISEFTQDLSYVPLSELNDSLTWITNGNDIYNKNSGNVGIGTNTPLGILHIETANDPELIITESGARDDYLLISNINSNTAKFEKATTSGTALLDFFPNALDGTSIAKTRFFRNTNTTGRVSLDIHEGDGTSAVNTSFSGHDNSYVNKTHGDFGVGTSSPVAKLQVTGGDIYVEDDGAAVILTSPNGTCYEVTVDNSGNLVTTSVTCP